MDRMLFAVMLFAALFSLSGVLFFRNSKKVVETFYGDTTVDWISPCEELWSSGPHAHTAEV